MTRETNIVMQTEIIADCYDGPKLNGVKPIFQTYCDGEYGRGDAY